MPYGKRSRSAETPDGKRHSIYAPTLERLREQEEQIIVDKHDGIRSDVKGITVNEMFDLWCQLKRGIKDTFTVPKSQIELLSKRVALNVKQSFNRLSRRC